MNEPISSNSEAREKSKPYSPQTPSEGLGEISHQMAELGAYLTSYLEAQRDRIKLGLRDAIWGLGLLPLLLLFVSGVVLTGIVFFLYGAAEGLGKLLEGQEWLGYLVLGGGLILITGLTVLYTFTLQRKRSLKKQMKQYERELAEQRKQFGYDAETRAQQNS